MNILLFQTVQIESLFIELIFFKLNLIILIYKKKLKKFFRKFLKKII